MEKLLELILLDYKKSAAKCSKGLEVEESSNTLAALQGELSSCKLFLDLFDNSFSSDLRYQTITHENMNMPDLTKLTDKQLTNLEEGRLRLESYGPWEDFLSKIESRRVNKKEWLFSSAEKGRDLIHTHAWRDGLNKHVALRNSIEREYEWRKEQNQLFDDDLQLSSEESDLSSNDFKLVTKEGSE